MKNQDSYGFSAYYDDLYYRTQENLDAICKICEKGNTPVLDLGGGTGVVGQHLVKRCIPCLTVDKSSEMIFQAERRRVDLDGGTQLRWEINQADILEWETKDRFDRILALGGSLAFLRSREEILFVLKKIARWLSSEGLFYLEVFNLDYWMIQTDWRLGKWQFWYETNANCRKYLSWIRTLPVSHSELTRYEKCFSEGLKGPYYWATCETISLNLEEWRDLLRTSGLLPIETFSSWNSHIEGVRSSVDSEHNIVGIVAQKFDA